MASITNWLQITTCNSCCIRSQMVSTSCDDIIFIRVTSECFSHFYLFYPLRYLRYDRGPLMSVDIAYMWSLAITVNQACDYFLSLPICYECILLLIDEVGIFSMLGSLAGDKPAVAVAAAFQVIHEYFSSGQNKILLVYFSVDHLIFTFSRQNNSLTR